MATPRVTVDESLAVSRVTVADTAPRVVVSETTATTNITVSTTNDAVRVVLSPTAAGVASINGLTGVVDVQSAITARSDITVPGTTTANLFVQGDNTAPGAFTSFAENPTFHGYNLLLGTNGVAKPDLTGISMAAGASGSGVIGYRASTDKLVQSRDGVVYYDIPVSTTELGEGTNLYYTDARADARVAAGIGAIDYPVDSVNGKTNTVVLTTSDISEGTNQYYTTARVNSAFDTRLATKTTDNLAQGTTNKYFANGLARSAISVSGSLSYSAITGVISYTTPTTIASLSNHTTDGLAEGTTNKYYTDARADARVAIGIAALVDTAPATLDTLNELAAALGDDPNFATTISTALGTKLATADFTSTADTWLATKTTTNLNEGTNLYYTTSRANSDFDTRLATKSTTNLAEGTNLYYTTARSNTDFDGRLATKTTDNLSEGSTNLYYTDARVTSRINNTSIDALSDVVITTGTAGQMIYYNGTAWVNSATVDSANLNRFSRTASGTGANAVLAISRNRGDAARAVDGGPWLSFEYVGTDNTQATSFQNAIRSRYQTSGNHVIQFLQGAGDYNAPTMMGQFQRGNYFLNTTGGVAAFLLTDTLARLGGNTTNITNSANTQTYASFGATSGSINQDTLTVKNNAGTTTYATFASTGTTITGAGLHTLSRTTVGTPGATESRPSFNIQLIRSDQAAPSNNDGTGFRYRTGGSNGTIYTIADMTSGYSTTGDAAWFLNLANGDQTGATFSSVNIISSKITETRIRAGTASATPGGSSVSDVAIFTPTNNTLKANALTLTDYAGTALVGNKINYSRVYGQWQYNSTITAAAANTAYVFPIGTPDFSNVASVGSTSRIILGAPGMYNLQFSVQIENGANAEHIAYIWLRKNGADLANSTGRVTLAKSASTIAGWNFVIDSANTTDYYEIAYAVNDTALIFTNYASTAFCPGTATLVTTVTPIGA